MPGFDMHFIAENTLPADCRDLLVCRGEKTVGRVGMERCAMPALGERRYSFGVLSDVRLTGSAASLDRLAHALSELRRVGDIDFAVIAGDITDGGTAAQLASYRAAVGDADGLPVYAVTGEHDCLDSATAPTDAPESARPLTGWDLYFSFVCGEDVFLLLGLSVGDGTPRLSSGALDWLSAVLAENADRRCFVITHLPHTEGSGTLQGADEDALLADASAERLRQILADHGRVIRLHGHTHLPPSAQTVSPTALYDCLYGCHSVHIPPLGTEDASTADGTYGFAVIADVYDGHIVLRCRDLTAGKFVPIAQYCIAVG